MAKTPEEIAAEKATKAEAKKASAAKTEDKGDNSPSDGDDKPEPTKTPDGYQMVSTADLKAMIEAGKEAQRLVKQLMSERDENRNNSSIPKVIKKVTEYTASVRKYEGKIVVGYVNHSRQANGRRYVYQKPDPTNPKEKEDWIDLLLQGEDKPVTILYLDFLNIADKVVCKIKDIKKKEMAIEPVEYVNKIEYGDWSRKETDTVVPVEVEWVERTFVLEDPETGEDITLNELLVNA